VGAFPFQKRCLRAPGLVLWTETTHAGLFPAVRRDLKGGNRGVPIGQIPMGRDPADREKHRTRGFTLLEKYDHAQADREFRLAGDPLGRALVAFHEEAWERAASQAISALGESAVREDARSKAAALQILSASADHLSPGGEGNDRRARLRVRADPLLEGVDWAQVTRHMGELARENPRAWARLASTRMANKLAKSGTAVAARLALEGNLHQARLAVTQVADTVAGSRMAVAWPICDDCLDEAETDPLTISLAESAVVFLVLPADSREEALVLGIAGLHAGAWLQGQGRSEMELQKGRHLAEFLPHAEAMFDALPSLPPLDPAVWEGREALLASCLAYYRASAASLRQDWPRARELLESLVSGPPGPWTERGEEALDRVRQRIEVEDGKARHRALRERRDVARASGDAAGEQTALAALVAEPDPELTDVERLARLSVEAGAPDRVERVREALNCGSHDPGFLPSLIEEARRRVGAGQRREALSLYRLARRAGTVERSDLASMAALLLSIDRGAEAGRAFEEIAPLDPRHWLDAAQAYSRSGEETRARRALRALFDTRAPAALLEEGLRLAREVAPLEEVGHLASRLLERDPANALAAEARTAAKAEAALERSRAAAQRTADGLAAAGRRDWAAAVAALAQIPEDLLSGEGRLALARGLKARGETERALPLYERLPPTPEVLEEMARGFVGLRRYDEARRALRRRLDAADADAPFDPGTDPDLRGLVAELQGDLLEAARSYDDATLLDALAIRAAAEGNALAELEALAVLAGRGPEAFGERLASRLAAHEATLPLRAKEKFARGRLPELVLCDTNVLLVRLVEEVAPQDTLQRLRKAETARRFARLLSERREFRLAVTPGIEREFRAVLVRLAVTQEEEDDAQALATGLDRVDAFLTGLEMPIAGRSPPTSLSASLRQVRAFYGRHRERVRAITRRKVRQSPTPSRKQEERGGKGGPPLPERMDLRLLAEAVQRVEAPLPGFSGVAILSDDADFRAFAAEIEREFGVRIL